MGSAQLDLQQAATGTENSGPQAQPLDLKREAAERLAAHRRRRAKGPYAGEGEEPGLSSARRVHHPIAAAVAERFSQTPTYRSFLAEQAQRAVEQAARDAEHAAAEAEIAARNAQAIAHAQQQLLAELELWNAPQEFTAESAITIQTVPPAAAEPALNRAEALKPEACTGTITTPAPESPSKPKSQVPVKRVSTAGFTVRLYEGIGEGRRVPVTNQQGPSCAADPEEFLALEEEIAFRQSPVFEPFDLNPPTPLPANLLEFPRQLVASRKARPRLAEGPLLEEQPRSPQLRIFEVEPEQISTAPTLPSVTPEWANIYLDAQPSAFQGEAVTATGVASGTAAGASSAQPALLPSMLRPQTAPLELRAMALAVDSLLIGTAFVAFAAIAAHFVQHIPGGLPAALIAGTTLALFWPLYELLFFSLSDQTPGMRYARVGFCTLADDNPSRSAVRRRIVAQLIAIFPFGLGLVWALLDEDGLGWHDRISGMYVRAY